MATPAHAEQPPCDFVPKRPAYQGWHPRVWPEGQRPADEPEMIAYDSQYMVPTGGRMLQNAPDIREKARLWYETNELGPGAAVKFIVQAPAPLQANVIFDDAVDQAYPAVPDDRAVYFFINGEVVQIIRGTEEFTTYEFPLPEGRRNLLEWRYRISASIDLSYEAASLPRATVGGIVIKGDCGVEFDAVGGGGNQGNGGANGGGLAGGGGGAAGNGAGGNPGNGGGGLPGAGGNAGGGAAGAPPIAACNGRPAPSASVTSGNQQMWLSVAYSNFQQLMNAYMGLPSIFQRAGSAYRLQMMRHLLCEIPRTAQRIPGGANPQAISAKASLVGALALRRAPAQQIQQHLNSLFAMLRGDGIRKIYNGSAPGGGGKKK